MILPNLKAIGIATLAGLLLGSGATWYVTALYKDAIWSAATKQLQVDAAQQLQVATTNAMEIERVAQVKVRELEAQYVQEEALIQDMDRRNRLLAAQLGGLRDPGRRQGGPNSMPTATTNSSQLTCPPGESIFSREATEAILTASTEGQQLYGYAVIGYEYAQSIEVLRQLMEEPQ